MSHERLTVLKGGMLRYRYDVCEGFGFDFNTLAEVGQPYQQWFRDEFERRCMLVEHGLFLDDKPYVADFVLFSGKEVV